ncbi:HIT family protein [Alisedimentitalea sp. MJ-SS2]|uniref:HIT family protein n=1 Tax=Aliisedimentitalea sp. MJ-SS2 TaxID=3049795 RepID=UPI00290EB826|nr:HIT family protein [Alisedimentitalea sp. MJ-SS2]MDU8928019.1 HIT family protein [Alisedimentitalea sp. MJ-SS2]
MTMADHADCIFCKIARGEISATEVYRDDRIVAFLDLGPIRPGHVLIIPQEHFPYFDDLPADLAASIMHLGQRLARVQKSELGVDKVGFMFSGGDVAHVHAHLVPMHEKTDLTSRRYIVEENVSFAPCLPADVDDLAAMAEQISKGLASD